MLHSWSLIGGLFEGGLSLVVVVVVWRKLRCTYGVGLDKREMINHFTRYAVISSWLWVNGIETIVGHTYTARC